MDTAVLRNTNASVREVPRTVALEVLYGCNLKCGYCYVGTQKNHRAPTVAPLERIVSILERIQEAGVRQVYLIGGEPTLHPQISEICRAISKLGFEARGIVSNGTRINQEFAELLQREGFWADVSFRAPNKKLFAEISGHNSGFDMALRGVRNLSDAGVEFGVEFDCIPANHRQLFETIELLASFGPKHVVLHRIAPSGDAANNPTLQLDVEDYRNVFEQAARVQSSFGIPTFFEDGFPLCLIEPKFWVHIRACDCGDGLLTVSPTGEVRRCACDTVALGNVFETEFGAICSSELEEFHEDEWRNPECTACAVRDRCNGGCGASDKPEIGYAPDRFSPLFRAITEAPDDPAYACAAPALLPPR